VLLMQARWADGKWSCGQQGGGMAGWGMGYGGWHGAWGAGLCDDGVDERGGGAAEVPVAHVDDGAHAQAHARAVL
jgi:hypothetical protein